jgi:hypothetical protein
MAAGSACTRSLRFPRREAAATGMQAIGGLSEDAGRHAAAVGSARAIGRSGAGFTAPSLQRNVGAAKRPSGVRGVAAARNGAGGGNARPGRPEQHAERMSAGRCERRLLASAVRLHAPPSAGSRRPRGPACVPISCAARAPYREENLARRLLAGAEGSHAPPAGGRLTERKTWRSACWRAPRDLMRRLLAGALQREKPGAPPAGGRRGQVELLAHAYATCDVMSGLDKGPWVHPYNYVCTRLV